MKTIAVILAVVAAAMAIEKEVELPVARVTLRALDEGGNPIPAAFVTMSFQEAIPQWGGGKLVSVTGLTDNEGKFTGEGHSLDTKGGQIDKAGYYSSSPKAFKFKTVASGKWQPWNPTLDVVLKKVVRPVPMYAKFKFETEMPADGPVGFDLHESDWVAPYGHGQRADLIFQLAKKINTYEDFGAELIVTFPNVGDGIVELTDTSHGASRLRSAHKAPEHGFAPSLSLRQGSSPDRGEYGTTGDHKDYWIRVRTVLDERGQVVTALYGKIYDGIEYFPVESKTAKLRFTYYLNPTPNDRGMEFDVRANLFKNLKQLEKPTAP